MNTFDEFQPEVRRHPRAPAAWDAADTLRAGIQQCVAASAKAFEAIQHADGHWRGDLTADTTLESDYILLQLWLYPPKAGGWNPPTRAVVGRCCRAVLDRQLPDGGWSIYPRGPSDVNASVKAYSALKIAGVEGPEMLRAKERILQLGGVQECNSYVRINLSLFGLYPRRDVPTVPPEMVLLPGDILYELSSWTRLIVVPLSIVQAVGGIRRAPDGITLDFFYFR